MDTAINFNKYQSVLNKTYFKKLGKVENVVGLTIESAGPDAKLMPYLYRFGKTEFHIG